VLKPLGYATGPVRQEPSRRPRRVPADAHGFDEFFGNLYHLNAEEEPENEDYPKDPEFRKKFGPRGVLRLRPTARSRTPVRSPEAHGDGRRGVPRRGQGLHRPPDKAGKPFFVWFNSTRMHVFTHLKPASKGKTGLGIQADGMVEHDGTSAKLLKQLDDLKIADNTIVIYTSDNGAMKNQWPDGGASPFRSEKDTGWEGAVRVPALIRWPGTHQAGFELHGAVLGRGLVADARCRGWRRREPPRKCLKGVTAGTKTFKVHIDGYNSSTTSPASHQRAHGRSTSTSAMTASSSRTGTSAFKYHFVIQQATGMNVWRMRSPRCVRRS
jgi:arylsulfatase